MNRLALPASLGCISGIIAVRLWKKGCKDISLVLGLGTAVIGWFCIFDFRRSRDPDYKKALIARRKADFESQSKRPILNVLKSLEERFGTLDALKSPMTNQQTMMQFIQTGEVYIQQGDKINAIKYFSFSATMAYIAGGVEKAQQLLKTIGGMIPALAESLHEEFEKDKHAVDDYIKANEPRAKIKSRDQFVSNLKKATIIEDELDEDPIDESDDGIVFQKKSTAKIVEPVPEAKVQVEEVINVTEASETESSTNKSVENVIETVPSSVENVAEFVEDAADAVKDSAEVVKHSAEVVEDSAEEVKDSTAVVDDSSEVVDYSSEVVKVSAEAVDDSSEVVKDSSEVVTDSAEVVKDSAEAVDDSAEVVTDSAEVVKDSAEAVDDSAEAVDDSAEVVKDSAEAIEDSAEAIEDSAEAIEDSAEAIEDSAEAIKTVEESTKCVDESIPIEVTASEPVEKCPEPIEQRPKSTEEINEIVEPIELTNHFSEPDVSIIEIDAAPEIFDDVPENIKVERTLFEKSIKDDNMAESWQNVYEPAHNLELQDIEAERTATPLVNDTSEGVHVMNTNVSEEMIGQPPQIRQISVNKEIEDEELE